MSEDILATEIGLAKDEILTEDQLQELVQTGRKRKLKKLPEVVIITTAEDPAVVSAPPVASEPVAPKEPWADFSPQSRRLVGHFIDLRESHVLDESMRRLIQRCSEATRVEDFAEFSDSQLALFGETLRNRLPSIHRNMEQFMSRIATARPMTVEVDFI